MKERGSSRPLSTQATIFWWSVGILGALSGSFATGAAAFASHGPRDAVLLLSYGVLGFTLFAVAMTVLLKRSNRLSGQASSSLSATRMPWVVAGIGLLVFALLMARVITFPTYPA